MTDPLVLINAFEVPDGEAGHVDTALHQAIAPGAGRSIYGGRT